MNKWEEFRVILASAFILLSAEPQMTVFQSFPEEKHGNLLGSVLRVTDDCLQE